MSAQECTAALKIQDAWREWQRLYPLCTCTTVFYPDGDKMIPEKHVCLRCYERMQQLRCLDCGMMEDFPLDGSVLRSHMTHDGIPRCHKCQSAYAEHEEHEQKENAALKIQGVWQKYRESKDSCPICFQIIGEDSCKTKCGHKICTGRLLKAVQRKNSCPMCRGELIKTEEDDDMLEVHEPGMSMFDGDELDAAVYQRTDYEQGYEDAVNESFNASYSYQQGYAEGIEAGREEAQEEFQPRMREEIDIATQKAYDDGVVQGRSMASEDIRLLMEEIDRLKRSNSRLREDLQFATQPTRELY